MVIVGLLWHPTSRVLIRSKGTCKSQGRQGETKNASPRGSGGSKSELSESNLGVFRWLLPSHGKTGGYRPIRLAVRLIKPVSKDSTWRYLPFFQQPNSVLLPINAINLLHDPFSPLNSSTYQGFRPRAWLGIEEILSCFQMTGH